jgi:hypothetical protein
MEVLGACLDECRVVVRVELRGVGEGEVEGGQRACD